MIVTPKTIDSHSVGKDSLLTDNLDSLLKADKKATLAVIGEENQIGRLKIQPYFVTEPVTG